MAGLVRDLVYVGIKGSVVALDRATGSERWRAKLKGRDFVTLVSDGHRLYASAAGEVFCVDPGTGAVLWSNPMKGLGLGIVSLLPGTGAGGPSDVAPVAAQRRVQQQQST